jgi:hypothetical protein
MINNGRNGAQLLRSGAHQHRVNFVLRIRSACRSDKPNGGLLFSSLARLVVLAGQVFCFPGAANCLSLSFCNKSSKEVFAITRLNCDR